MANTNPARGMRDFLPADVRKREYVIGIIKEVYESYGFEPLETPAVENIETLMGKYGEEGNQLIFKILKRGEKLREEFIEFRESGELKESGDSLNSLNSTNSLTDLALRYDLTVPLARVVANRKNDLPKFFKRYQIQPVWRADRPARGRFREFWQCDVDVIGSSSMVVEAELISAISDILKRLGFHFLISINHREILNGVLDVAGVPREKHADALVALDKLDKIGPDGLFREFSLRGIDGKAVLKLLNDLTFLMVEAGDKVLASKDNAERHNQEVSGQVLKKLEEYCSRHPGALKGIDELKRIFRSLEKTGASDFLSVQPRLARGLSYYTGSIMEIEVGKEIGSLGGGGRYDGLIGMFGKEQIPACGFSLGLERILVVMDERNMFPAEVAATSADVMVTIWNEESIGESLKLANELRQQGLRVLVYPEADKLGKQLKYADSIKVPYVCVLGESELAENKVTLKNMETGEQETIERSLTSAKLRNRVKSPLL